MASARRRAQEASANKDFNADEAMAVQEKAGQVFAKKRGSLEVDRKHSILLRIFDDLCLLL